ncbi:MAG: hypothetical protein H6633_09605 [Anaerolineales bacterium]|nr:hypothetical protein [Anaerolineales bacterium]
MQELAEEDKIDRQNYLTAYFRSLPTPRGWLRDLTALYRKLARGWFVDASPEDMVDPSNPAQDFRGGVCAFAIDSSVFIPALQGNDSAAVRLRGNLIGPQLTLVILG